MSDEKRRTAAQFGNAAESYFDSEAHHPGANHETLVSWCRGVIRALDVTTGANHTAGTIADAGVSSAITADAVPEMAVTAVREYPVAGVVADARRFPFAGDAFDAAACRTAAHHFPDPEAFVAGTVCVLEPGGVFAFEDNVAPEDAALAAPLSGVEVLRNLTHVELHSASRWHKWFTAAGLSVETVETAAIRLQFGPWTERTNVLPADRDEFERRFRETPKEAKELFDVEFDGDSVVSFANPGALVRARMEQMSRVAASSPRPAETHKR